MMDERAAEGLFGIPELEFLADQPDDSTTPEDHAAWLQHRRSGLTGSDVAAIFNEHGRKRPIDVFYDKRPDLAPEAFLAKMREEQARDDARLRGGRLLEPVVAGWFAKGAPHWERSGGPYVSVVVPTMRRRDRPWQVISPDRALYLPECLNSRSGDGTLWDETGLSGVDISRPRDRADRSLMRSFWRLRPDGGVEIKTHGFAYGRYLPDPDDDGAEFDLPARLRLQSLWYASGMNQPGWMAAALVDTHLQHTWPIRALPEIVDPMLEEAERWWSLHVVDGEVPSPDGSESFQRHLRALYKKHDDLVMPARRDVDALARDLKAKTLAKKRAEIDVAELKQRIQEVIGTHLGIETAEGVMTWKETAAGTPKWKEIAHAIAHQHGMTDAEIEAVVSANTPEGSRRFNTAQWTRGMK